MNSNIKSRQLRKQFDYTKIKEIASEMNSTKQLGLKIEKEKLGVKSLTFLEDFVHLEKLSIYNISKDISTVSQLVNLKEIALCGLKLSNLDFLKNLPNLEYLWFQGSTLKENDSFRELKRLKAIKFFGLRKLENISFLEDMNSLQYINFDSCSNIIEFPDLKKLTHLRRVHLDTMLRLKDISKISKAPNLEDLIVNNTKNLPTDCFNAFINNKSTMLKIRVGNALTNSRQYKETILNVPIEMQMKEFYGTDKEQFEIKTLHNNV